MKYYVLLLTAVLAVAVHSEDLDQEIKDCEDDKWEFTSRTMDYADECQEVEQAALAEGKTKDEAYAASANCIQEKRENDPSAAFQEECSEKIKNLSPAQEEARMEYLNSFE